MLILPCYARRRGLGLRVFMTDVSIVNYWLTYGGNFNTHLGGLRHLGNTALPVFLEIPGYRVIVLWTATQAQRDHEIIHARNFCVQPQATMGSSIVD